MVILEIGAVLLLLILIGAALLRSANQDAEVTKVLRKDRNATPKR